jgi:VWFA-related protein
MRSCKLILSTLSLTVGFVGFVANVAAAEYKADALVRQSAAPSAAPTIQVYSRETLVDVTVTDAKGQPVRGLTQSDFTIAEDGKPQSIRSFKEFGRNLPVAQRVAAKLPPNVYTNLQPTDGPLTVLLFDDLNGGDRIQARSAAAKFIREMDPGTRVALLGLGARFTILHGPTSDSNALQRVIHNGVDPFRAATDPKDPCRRQIALDWGTLDELKQVATYLSGIAGKKSLIWIGNGIDDLVSNVCQVWTLRLQQTYDLLEDAEVTVYPLDPNGVGTLGPRQLALEAVAEATGGAAFYGRNDLETLMAGAVEAGSDYYTLSYIPPSFDYDGRYHAISIKTNKPGLNLVYRKGYTSEDPELIRHPPETFFGVQTRDTRPDRPEPKSLNAAMSPIVPPATQLLFDVQAQPTTEPPMPTDPPMLGALDPKLRGAPLTRYDILYMIPQSEVAFAGADAGAYAGSLEFDLAAYDSAGKLVTTRSQTLQLPLSSDEYRQFIATPFKFFQQLDLPPGQFTLRVGILDGVSNKVGTIDVPVTISRASGERAAQR